MVVLANRIAPASLRRAAGGASASAGVMSLAAVPTGVGSPLVAMLSLTVTGTPSSGPIGSALIQRASEARASFSARSGA